MKLLLTGKGTMLGDLLFDALQTKHQVSYIGRDECDYRLPEVTEGLCQNKDAILHCDVVENANPSEQETLDWATRGTYSLLKSAVQTDVQQVILVSTMALFDSYPENFVVDETWQPQPEASAQSLAPYLAELACREFARQGGVRCMALRFGAIEEAEGTSASDAIRAVEGALAFEYEPHGYRWHVYHVYSGQRFMTRGATQALKLNREVT